MEHLLVSWLLLLEPQETSQHFVVVLANEDSEKLASALLQKMTPAESVIVAAKVDR